MKNNMTFIIFNSVAFLVFLLIVVWSKDELVHLYSFNVSNLEGKKPFLILMIGFGLTGILIQFTFLCKKILK